MSKFPEGFMVGAATAAHQVEGNNIHSDYWLMEHMESTEFAEPSGDAVDHYNRFEDDIKMLKAAGLNSYRFSIEWARIEPEEGKFDDKEIEHYRQVLQCCRDNGVEPIVTMMHFTSPVWIIKNGGWEAEGVVDAFADYCKYVVEQLGDLMHYVVTINEANMGLQVAKIAERYRKQMMAKMAAMQGAQAGAGMQSPQAGAGMQNSQTGVADQKANVEGLAQIGMNFNSMMENMKKKGMENAAIFGTPDPKTFVSARTPEGDILVMKAHQAAKAAMKAVKSDLQIGLSLSLHDIQPVDGGEEVAKAEWDEEFLHYVPYIKDDDFFGLQNYTRSIIGPDGIRPVPDGAETTQMDYEFYPVALKHVIEKAEEVFRAEGREMPIIVTENGIATADDSRRQAFISQATDGVAECIKEGIPVKGYMYWSLMDNFEWQKGFSMTFGLIAVDRSTQTRTAKPSLKLLGSFV